MTEKKEVGTSQPEKEKREKRTKALKKKGEKAGSIRRGLTIEIALEGVVII